MIDIDFQRQLNAPDGKMNLQIKLALHQGDFLAISGPSGSGKSSTLKLISGLMTPDIGKIKVENDYWFDSSSKINLVPSKRAPGFVFQDYALFPNMTVIENILFACDDSLEAGKLIDEMKLGALRDKKPLLLSGGQQQRVAIARALVSKPKVLLLDEPFSALDDLMKADLENLVFRYNKEFGLTIILVTHDIASIIKLANQVLVLDRGKIVKQGEPKSVFYSSNLEGVIIAIESDFALVQIGKAVFRINKKEEWIVGEKISFVPQIL